MPLCRQHTEVPFPLEHQLQSQYRAPQYCLIGAFLVAWKLPPWAQKGQKDSRSAMLAVAELHQLAQHLFTPGSPTRKGS